MTVFGGEVGWASRSEQPFGGGTNLYQKPMPKQDKEGGIIPAFDLRMPRFQNAGNPRFEYLYEFIRLLKK